LFEWYEQKREFDELLTIEDAGVQMVAMAHFARELGAGYLLVDEFWQVAEVPTGMELLFSNSEYALLVVE
ncbi:MAG: hypothetical protein KJZ53_05865, partial [Anaerolineales bacterium]|nr:hypothetical protein [Anaerolineales bacterium]